MAYSRYQYVGDPSVIWDDCRDSKRRRQEDEDKDCTVRVYNTIDIRAEAKGGDGGDGGDGGEDNSSASAAASRGGVSVAVPVTVDVEQEEKNVYPLSVPSNGADGLSSEKEVSKDLNSVPNGNSAGLAVDNIAIASSGKGGDGGDGGDVKQSIYAKIDNWTVVVCGNEKEFKRGITLSSDESDVDLKMENDDIFINGEKMTVKELKDGTKVFVLKKSTDKKN
ncbi:MAG: hypothetical protein GX285_01510 [Clostridiales bacterium]|nr:hypothetical protein [Clostridiales bacterium]